MKNHNGDVMKIHVINYHFHNLYNKLYDSDWLDAELIMIISKRKIKINLEFLILEELERIYLWLIQIGNKENMDIKLEFIDANLKFRILTRSKIPILKIMYCISDTKIVCWELIINTANLNSLANNMKTIINRYPCRCGKTHHIN
jgi:hypothetical protein